ncbi:16S rRNA (cytosine(967)-C(5))-methyltransferase RsmB [Seminibacterium arietis]|uniref:16S rRNA (cytosine(967)-C(5))-methyltransferase n=1 Tax=Seminibacterium arietis TaxID=1173502 RepID=A0ABW3I712_9PAST
MAKQKNRQKTVKLSVRALAAQLLFLVLEQGKSLSTLIPEQQSKIKPQDLPLLQEICFGVCRVLPRLDSIIAMLLDNPLKGKKRIVHCLLLVGLYQLLYLRVPAHAAVDEVVKGTESLNVGAFKNLVNAVLRRFLREKTGILAKVDQNWHTLHPDWFINRLKKYYSNWREIIEANNQKPPMWLRINQNYSNSEHYIQLLEQVGVKGIAEGRQSVRLSQPSSVENLPHFTEGWVTVQDLHAQWAASLLEPQNDELILDACAAPGGKTTHLLELAPKGKVVALDIEQNRLVRVNQNLQRLQQTALVIQGDATNPTSWLNQVTDFLGESAVQFDKILLDAPCSATGIIRRHPDIKWLRRDQDIEELVQLQKQILTTLWSLLKEGGVLLYATCSVLQEENHQQISAFLQSQSDAILEPLLFPLQENMLGYQFFPTENSGDGFYYAKLRKRVK